jgi:hypothetical protein
LLLINKQRNRIREQRENPDSKLNLYTCKICGTMYSPEEEEQHEQQHVENGDTTPPASMRYKLQGTYKEINKDIIKRGSREIHVGLYKYSGLIKRVLTETWYNGILLKNNSILKDAEGNLIIWRKYKRQFFKILLYILYLCVRE